MKARLVLLVAAGDRRRLPSPAAAAAATRGSDPATLAPPGRRSSSKRRCSRRRAEVEHRVAGQEHRRDRRPRRPDRRRTRRARPTASGEELDYARKSSPGWAKRPASSSRNTTATTSTATASRSRRTDTGAAQEFIDKQVEDGDEVPEEGSYEGVDYEVESDDGTTIGIIGDFLVVAEDEDDLQGDGRRLQRRIAGRRGRATPRPIDAAPSGSFADVFVDIGGLIDQSGGTIDPEAQAVPRQRRDRPRGSDRGRQPGPRLRPGRDRLQQRPQRREPPTGDASELLGSLPGELLRRLRLGRLRQSLRGSDRPDRRQRHPRRGPGRQVQERPRRKPASTSKRSPPRSATSASSPRATAKAASAGAAVLDDQGRQGSDQHRRQHRPAAAGHRHPGRHRDLRQGAAASRSAAPTSAPSRWSSPPRATGSRSPTACRRRPRRWRRRRRRPSPTTRPTRKRSARSAAPRSAASSTARRR